jgi:putative membrane protein
LTGRAPLASLFVPQPTETSGVTLLIEYDPHDWFGHFWDLRGSMVREIIGRVVSSVLWAALVVAVFRYGAKVGIPSTAHNLTGLAIGLLLVFRTNTSYTRFWEARRLWGSITNTTRNLARQSRQFLEWEKAPSPQFRLWLAAFAHATMHRLRGSRTDLGPASLELPKTEVEAVISAAHPPLAAAARLGALLREARQRGLINEFLHIHMEQQIGLLIDFLGGCERIHRTPLPFAYMVHLRRALILYCFSLPFALVRDLGWYTVPAVFLISYVFFGIEEIGVEIEDPFGHDDNDLPLERYCATIDRDVLDPGGVATPAPVIAGKAELPEAAPSA